MVRRYVYVFVVVLCLALVTWELWRHRRDFSTASEGCPGACGWAPLATVPATGPTGAEPPSPAATSADASEPNRSLGPLAPVAEKLEQWRTAIFRGVTDDWPAARSRIEGALWEAMRRQLADPAACIAAGDRAMSRLDFKAAAACFLRARRLDPNSLDAAKGHALALTAAGKHEEAAAAYRELLERIPGDRTTKYNLAVATAKTGRSGEAQELFAQLVEADPDFLEAWSNLAALCTAAGKLSRAKEAWSRAAELAPRSAYPCLKLGETLMDLEEPNEALAAFVEAAQRDPNDPTAHMNVAAVSVQLGGFGRAVLAVQRAAALAPQDAGVWASLGNLRATIYKATQEIKFRQQAIEAWDKSIALDPNQPELKDNLDQFRKDLTTLPRAGP